MNRQSASLVVSPPGRPGIPRPVVRPFGPPVGSPVNYSIAPYYSNGSRLLMVFAGLLLASLLGRIFEKFLVGLHIPLVICGLAIVAAIFGGALRMLHTRLSMTLGMFIIWMAVCTPFSSWRSNSARYLVTYVALYLPFFLILAAAPRTLADLRKLFCIAALCCLLYIPTSGSTYVGSSARLYSEGTFGNAGELAQLVVFGLPFWIFLSLQFKNIFLRVISMVGGCGFMLIMLGKTATRSGVLALFCVAVIYFLRGTLIKRIFMMAGGMIVATVIFLVLPHSSIQRLGTITQALDSDDQGPGSDGPDSSVVERRDLMKDAIRMAVTHPVFGVGPGQFGQYRFNHYKRANGKPKVWFPAHNTYLQMASESGIAGLILYVSILLGIYKVIRRVRKLNADRPLPSATQFGWMCLCLEAALISFMVTAAFLNCDRYPYLFVLGGFALALERMAYSESVAAKESRAPAERPGIRGNGAYALRAW